MKIVNTFGSYRHKLRIILPLMLVLCALLGWAVLTAVSRINNESKNDSVEICLDWDEVCSLCALNNYAISDFLERSRAIGVTSVAIAEENLSTLSGSGKIIYFSGPEYSRAKLLDIVAQGGMVQTT